MKMSTDTIHIVKIDAAKSEIGLDIDKKGE